MNDQTLPAQKQWIAILDYGSQYTQLIARRIREREVYSEIIRCDTTAADLAAHPPAGVILSGGPNSVFEEGAPTVDPAIFEMGVPVLGICYGMQLMSQTLGGKVVPGAEREYGKMPIEVMPGNPLFDGIPSTITAWMSHGDRVEAIPANFERGAVSATCPFAAMHTQYGTDILANFVFKVCGCTRSWKLTTWVEDTVARLREQIGEDEVVLGLSGGVDSSVVAVLLNKAIGRRLHCIFVDNGLLRYREAEQVEEMFKKNLGLDLTVVHAEQRFYDALKGLDEPEAKRKAIGKNFIDVFAEEARRFRHCRYLGQGTIYPDVIESRSPRKGPSQTIKSHHNVGGLPDDLKFELVEPLRELFKDEVRAVGRVMGMADELLDRPRSRTRRAHPRRGDRGEGAPPAARGRARAGGDPQASGLQDDLADVRGAAAVPLGGRDGRPAHLRVHVRDPQRELHRRDDGGLDAHPLRRPRADVEPHHQRGARHQPRGVRHLLQAARHHRMGMR